MLYTVIDSQERTGDRHGVRAMPCADERMDLRMMAFALFFASGWLGAGYLIKDAHRGGALTGGRAA